MTEVFKTAPPLTHVYNLAGLGKVGDSVRFEADAGQREAIAELSGVVSLTCFAVAVALTKASPTRYALEFHLKAEIVQACVVTLEPVVSRIDHPFTRELHFAGHMRRPALFQPANLQPIILDQETPDSDEPEEIASLHYDLAAPVLEEYLLALDPYPRKAGVEFNPDETGTQGPESPFAVLKSLKSST